MSRPLPPPATDGRGTRPSRPATSAIVVARDVEIRDDWARSLEATGMRVARCVGPTVTCILERDGGRCPLLDDADLALYHAAVLTDEFVERLRASAPRAMIVATRDRHVAGDGHEPVLSRAIYP